MNCTVTRAGLRGRVPCAHCILGSCQQLRLGAFWDEGFPAEGPEVASAAVLSLTGSYCVALAGLDLSMPIAHIALPASALLMLRLKMCTLTPGLLFLMQ